MITDLNEKSELMAVVGFFNSSQYNMEICVASKQGWSASRKIIKTCFNYAFVQCNALRITSYVQENNEKSIYFHNRLGAKREFDGVLKKWFGDADGIQFVMMKEECKWL